ncbi:acetate--CoA ligase family protein [Nocardioides mesophilus]|uniref:Acetate--CoA ligase family protein n=1 Tax=Nocardioides mesophilus TaxID=433659 RepID=A0A7G9R9T4_9ACTN|nr:acetate--CoA ligase family protein [Nocardioides mesophilus]
MLQSSTPSQPLIAPTPAGTAGDALRDVTPLVQPRSVVVVGPSDRHASVLHNLLAGRAPVVGVHPGRHSVAGLPCVPSIGDLEHAPDLGVLMVGHRRVEQAFEELIAVGARGVVMPGLGSEAGVEGPGIAARLRSRAEAAGVAILGHNCMGIATPACSPWIGTLPDTFLPGSVAVVAQSGSVAEAFTTMGPRVGFRAVVSTGSEIGRDVADFLDHFAEDPATSAIGLFLETVRRPAAFVEALRKCAERGKPVVCLKVGRSVTAARVALAHTGAIVGSGTSFSAALARYGVIEVEDFQQLTETLELLGSPRPLGGVRLGAVSESGGECGLLADAADAAGIAFQPMAASLQHDLEERFPGLVAPQNPLDVWGLDSPERAFPWALDLMARSGQYDVIIGQVDLSTYRGPRRTSGASSWSGPWRTSPTPTASSPSWSRSATVTHLRTSWPRRGKGAFRWSAASTEPCGPSAASGRAGPRSTRCPRWSTPSRNRGSSVRERCRSSTPRPSCVATAWWSPRASAPRTPRPRRPRRTPWGIRSWSRSTAPRTSPGATA